MLVFKPAIDSERVDWDFVQTGKVQLPNRTWLFALFAFANFRIDWDLLGTTWLGFLVSSTWWYIALPTFDPSHWFSCWWWCIKLLKLLLVDCSQPNVEPNICRTKETRATLQMLASLLHYSSSLANTSLWVFGHGAFVYAIVCEVPMFKGKYMVQLLGETCDNRE